MLILRRVAMGTFMIAELLKVLGGAFLLRGYQVSYSTEQARY